MSTPFPFGQEIVWRPSQSDLAHSNLAVFMQRHGIATYPALLERAREDLTWFWDAVIDDLGVVFETPYERVVDLTGAPEFPRWCVGGRMNIAESMLGAHHADIAARDAIRWEGEGGEARSLTYADLNAEVSRCANALRSLGLGRGDAVGLLMPMVPEVVIAFLAVVKIGGVVLPLFSGYGADAIRARLQDAEAKALVTCDGAFRRGRAIPLKPTADAALDTCPSVRHVLVVQRAGDALEESTPMQNGRDVWWHDLVPQQPKTAETTIVSAEDTVMLIYTSGTTGKPKGAVHTHCGFPVKAAQDLRHSMDLRPGDVLWWMSDMGWMMGPWLVFGALLNGATMVLYDGAPDFPTPARTWEIAERHGVTHLGISPVLIRALRPHGADLVQDSDLSALRAICSTGSPWDPESWMWCFDHVLERKKPILNYSGGTEISGGIVCGTFMLPLKPCAFSGPVPGMDADVVDDAGEPVRGEVGELVVRQPWIGMTRGFWRDRERYLDSYWRTYPGVWRHGDFATIDSDGLWYILGRSDDTIKVAGKRVGPAEVEAVLNADASVRESAAVGVPDDVKGEALACFVVLAPGAEASEELRTRLSARVAEALGKPLKPRTLRFATALPKTRNAKVIRRAIRAVYLGEDLGDVMSLEDPATLDAIRDAA